MTTQTLFIDDRQQRRQSDALQHWFSEPAGADATRHQNLLQSALLGARLFLQPEAVLSWCHYWLAHYTQYALAEADWFCALVQELLYEPVQLELLCVDAPPAQEQPQPTLKAPRLLRFCGSARLSLPLEYVLQSGQLGVLYPLSELQRSSNGCFLQRTTDALDGELELSVFLYNGVLGEFYELGFLLLTLYTQHLCALLHSSGATASAALARHLHSLKPLAHEAIDWARVQAAHFAHGESTAPLARLQIELAQLHQVLYTTDLALALQQLDALWSAKASECHSQMRVRCERVAERAY